ncbi:MAG: hypothetical protein GY832_30165 [Chloroflexi bacterium]|nr:hypothetical protein [Chloroflexota bacterium]
MNTKFKLLLILVLLALCLGIPTPGITTSSYEQITGPSNLTPENTVILANSMDARFSQDFSVLLKHLRLEWIVLDSTVMPDSIQDKNLVVLGHPDAEYIGDLIRGMLTPEEIESLQAARDHHVVLEKTSPWMAARTIYICSGADMLLTRNAAEEAIRAIISNAPPVSDWIRTKYDAELDDNLRDYVKSLQYEWEDTELSLQDLTMDVGTTPRRNITAQQAAKDVERLFYLLSHGYSGYAFFNQQGDFEQAKSRILQELSSQSSWTSDALSRLLYEHLDFIVDCHMTIGDYRFAEHRDFWYDTRIELMPGPDGYQFASDGPIYTAVSINGVDPASFLYPSLNQKGKPIYRLALLSTEEPPPLRLVAANAQGEHRFEVKLQRSDFEYYSEDIFREDILGGIPVVRVRGFGDSHPDELNRFVETASSLRGEPVVIVDIRGNRGGNEHWPISWIHRLTDRRAESIFAFSELESKTSMVGRANAFNYWYNVSDVSSYSSQVAQFASITEAFENGTRQPSWRGPIYPQMPLIANDTTVILITNDLVASAGEGMVLRISQAENVVVVGENTMGCLTFGNLSAHQLPHSRLMIWMPINFGLFLDQEFREEVGLEPDLWVPAADAVNFTVAALRQGTITTSQPLPLAILQQDFSPEDPGARDRQATVQFLLVVAGFTAGGLVWAYFARKTPWFVAAIGGLWIIAGSVMTVKKNQPVGTGFLLVGIICLVWGGVNLLKVRRGA